MRGRGVSKPGERSSYERGLQVASMMYGTCGYAGGVKECSTRQNAVETTTTVGEVP